MDPRVEKKIDDLLNSYQAPEPNPDYVNQFWARLARRQTAPAVFWSSWKIALTLSLAIILASTSWYARERYTENQLATLDGEQLELIEHLDMAEHWDDLEDFETINDLEHIEQGDAQISHEV